MRSVAEYLEKAAEFDEMANTTNEPTLRKRFSDIAECYRLLARDRQRFIAGANKPSRLLARRDG